MAAKAFEHIYPTRQTLRIYRAVRPATLLRLFTG